MSAFLLKHPAPAEIYTLSLHDALPISGRAGRGGGNAARGHLAIGDARDIVRSAPELRRSVRTSLCAGVRTARDAERRVDRKSTRLNSSHSSISYAVFCLKKKKLKYMYV